VGEETPNTLVQRRLTGVPSGSRIDPAGFDSFDRADCLLVFFETIPPNTFGLTRRSLEDIGGKLIVSENG